MHHLANSIHALLFFILALCLLPLSATLPAQEINLDDLKSKVKVPEQGKIRLPLRVHIMTELRINHPKRPLTCWFEPSYVDDIIKEVNLIWRQANIEWFVESIVEHKPVAKNAEAAIRQIVDAKRDSDGNSDPDRIPKVYSFFDADKHYPVIQNLYFFPFIGNTSQGYANDPNTDDGRTSNHAVVGTWSNKVCDDGVPYRTTIGERSRYGTPNTLPQKDNYFEKGSLGRTCAHELGHHMNLDHPKPETQTSFRRLMGGKRKGYLLTPEEIVTARREALKRGHAFLAWKPELLEGKIAGKYRHQPTKNDWHQGTITAIADKPGRFLWTNKAGKSWHLKLEADQGRLMTDRDNPYFDVDPANGRQFRLDLQREPGKRKGNYAVKGFRFKTNLFQRQAD